MSLLLSNPRNFILLHKISKQKGGCMKLYDDIHGAIARIHPRKQVGRK
jgi:hypothetical protein